MVIIIECLMKIFFNCLLCVFSKIVAHYHYMSGVDGKWGTIISAKIKGTKSNRSFASVKMFYRAICNYLACYMVLQDYMKYRNFVLKQL